jgi:dihydrofolate reductase
MTKVFLNLTMSLDGYVAGNNITEAVPMGEHGDRLHDWLFDSKTERDNEIIKETFTKSGAVIVGGHTYTLAIKDAWGGKSPFDAPAFVVIEKQPEFAADGFTFVTDGIESALSQARKAAGDKDVWIMGGANIAQQYIKAGLLDELQITIAPMLLGEGLRLFEHTGAATLKHVGVVQTPAATHITYQVITPRSR